MGFASLHGGHATAEYKINGNLFQHYKELLGVGVDRHGGPRAAGSRGRESNR